MNETNMLQQVAELTDMSTADLRKLWQELYQTPPPLFNKASLINKLAYRIQELHYGGLATATRKQLRQIANGQSAPKRPIVNRPVAGIHQRKPVMLKTPNLHVRRLLCCSEPPLLLYLLLQQA